MFLEYRKIIFIISGDWKNSCNVCYVDGNRHQSAVGGKILYRRRIKIK